MERKMKYEGPSMEITMLGIEDIITTSGLNDGGTGGGGNLSYDDIVNGGKLQ